MTKRIVLPAICFFLMSLVLQSCDEFMLKKTVAVENLTGDIAFDPSSVSLSGSLNYDIRNNQNENLTEIYLISHNQVSVDYLSYENDTTRFEQGIGYGYGIYRIKIPPLGTGKKAKIELRFHINGPVEEDRFLLTKDNVFIDAEKIWLPVPFAQAPNFLYNLRIRTPENYFAVFGARLVEESTNGGKRSSVWQSETEDVVLSGNLFISRFLRIKKDPVTVYSFRTNNSDAIFKYANQTLKAITARIGPYPYSQVHIVSEIFQYKDMEEFIDGESIANIIQISPDIVTNTLLSERETAQSVSPDIPRNSAWKIFETLAHELSHAYIRGIIKFEDENYIESESLAEFMGLKIISLSNTTVYDKFIQRNRIELMNLFITGNRNSKLLKYLYGVNCLNAAFSGNSGVFFDYIKTLVEKYGYTKIQPEQLVSTAQEMNYTLTNGNGAEPGEYTNRLIYTEALKLWSCYGLYNLGISLSNIWITNYLTKKRFALEEKSLLTLENDFPIDIPVTLIENYKNRSSTNRFKLEKNSEIGIIVDKNLLNAFFQSRYECLERSLSDNEVNLPMNEKKELYRNISEYYRNGPSDKIPVDGGNWKNLSQDRKKSLSFHSGVSFQFDQLREIDGQFYLVAYKLIDNKPFSYVVFRGKKKASKYYVTSVIDPVL